MSKYCKSYIINLIFPGIICFLLVQGIFYQSIILLAKIITFAKPLADTIEQIILLTSFICTFFISNSVMSNYSGTSYTNKAITKRLLAFILTVISINLPYFIIMILQPTYFTILPLINVIATFLGIYFSEKSIIFCFPKGKDLYILMVILIVSYAITFPFAHCVFDC